MILIRLTGKPPRVGLFTLSGGRINRASGASTTLWSFALWCGYNPLKSTITREDPNKIKGIDF